MTLKEILEVVPIKDTIMVVIYNDANSEKFIGNSMDLIYRLAEFKYRKVFNIHCNNILTIFIE